MGRKRLRPLPKRTPRTPEAAAKYRRSPKDRDCYKLDPRHSELLNDHWSGFIWLRQTHRNAKYKGAPIFVDDLGNRLDKAVKRRLFNRKMHYHMMRFGLHGYIFGNTDFIKILACSKDTPANWEKALKLQKELITKLRYEARLAPLQRRFGVTALKPKPVRKKRRPGAWAWAFRNEALGIEFKNIGKTWVQINEGMRELPNGKFELVAPSYPVGYPHSKFCSDFKLNASMVDKLAKGKVLEYKGWVLVGKPRWLEPDEILELALEWEQSDGPILLDEALRKFNS